MMKNRDEIIYKNLLGTIKNEQELAFKDLDREKIKDSILSKIKDNQTQESTSWFNFKPRFVLRFASILLVIIGIWLVAGGTLTPKKTKILRLAKIFSKVPEVRKVTLDGETNPITLAADSSLQLAWSIKQGIYQTKSQNYTQKQLEGIILKGLKLRDEGVEEKTINSKETEVINLEERIKRIMKGKNLDKIKRNNGGSEC